MLLRLNTLLDDLHGKISFVAALTVYRPARALGLMQIEIFNLPHCYLFWPRISTFNCLVFFVWDSQLLVWSDLLQVELQLFSLYPPLRVQGPWRRTQLLHLFVGDDDDDVGDDDGDLQIHQVYGFRQFSFGPLLLHMSNSKATTESNREKSKRSPEELRGPATLVTKIWGEEEDSIRSDHLIRWWRYDVVSWDGKRRL